MSTTTNPTVLEHLAAQLNPYRREITGSGLLFLAVVTVLSLSSFLDSEWERWWANIISQLFGWGALPATLLVAGFGFLLTFGRLKEEYRHIPVDIVLGLELLLMVGLASIHLIGAIFYWVAPFQLATSGAGGGLIGWGVSSFLVSLVGPSATSLVLILLGLLALGLTFRKRPADLMRWASFLSTWANRKARNLQPSLETEAMEPPNFEKSPVEAEPVSPQEVIRPSDEVKKTSPPNLTKSTSGKSTAESAKPGQLPLPMMPAQSPRLVVPLHVAKKALEMMPKRRHALPPLDLLEAVPENHKSNPYVDKQAKIIEETLESFGIPAKVVEKDPGPTITQFGVKLGTIPPKTADGKPRRVRVRKVMALTNDLALALSAAPIRIEAPIPGRPLVGIEVPNPEKSFVSLRGVMSTKTFQNAKAPLQIALGRGISGDPALASLVRMPHLLIAGATGSGKSVCLNALISALLFTHSPEQLRMLMVDPKMVELTGYNGVPHLIAPVVTDFEQVVGALSWVTREMERRYKLFAKLGARSITSFNQQVASEEDKLPYLVVVIDELADLMMLAPDEVERHICRIAQMARATGIHLVIATQRPSTDVITGLIKANFPARIAFAVTSQIDSRVILDTGGAEKLLGQGDMLYMAPDSPNLVRLQGCYVSDKELQNLVNYWTGIKPTPTSAIPGDNPDDSSDKLPWTDILAEAEKDDLLEEAVKLVVETKRASASFLQRRLGVGYPRASRLLDQLEDEGIIGPAEGSRPREVLWQDDQDEADYAELKEDVVGSKSA